MYSSKVDPIGSYGAVSDGSVRWVTSGAEKVQPGFTGKGQKGPVLAQNWGIGRPEWQRCRRPSLVRQIGVEEVGASSHATRRYSHR